MRIFRKLLTAGIKGWEQGKAESVAKQNAHLLEALSKLKIRSSDTGNPRADVPVNWALFLCWMAEDGFQELGESKPSHEKLIVALGILHHVSGLLCTQSGYGDDLRPAITLTAANYFFYKDKPAEQSVYAIAKAQDEYFYAKGHDQLMLDILDGVHGIFKRHDFALRDKVTAGIKGFLRDAAPLPEAAGPGT